jgi:twitching motility two-component system response regulator PilH
MPTVVIADDSPTLRRIVTSVLTKEGYDVVAAEDGVTAVQATFRTMPDACVFDVQMPRVSGYVAARVVKDDWTTAGIPIVLLTSLDAASDRYWGKQAGADRYLSKDFEAPELAAALSEVLAERAAAAGDVPAGLRPDPVELSDDDVLQRVCDLLDRKLFETSVQAEVIGLAGASLSFEETIEELLRQLQRFVDYDLCGVLLPDDKVAYVGVAHETSVVHYDEFLDSAADSLSQATGVPLPADLLDARLADPDELLDEDDDSTRMATYLSMPLRGRGGRVVGLLALSSATPNAFGETALSTLRLVETPAAVVIDAARAAAVRST